ncbi:MAG: DUF4129 domain-containing protein [Candidatus Heimdallarchaeota archaeon]|nr:DUF4129 domain-containing protein [Candidatus Heimdallarchaeota archaeon]
MRPRHLFLIALLLSSLLYFNIQVQAIEEVEEVPVKDYNNPLPIPKAKPGVVTDIPSTPVKKTPTVNNPAPYRSNIGIDAVASDIRKDFDEQAIITGTVQTALGEPYSFGTVEFYWDEVHDGSPAQTSTTDAQGDFSFTVDFVHGDVGAHFYEVYYPNTPVNYTRLPGVALEGNVFVFDTVTPSISTTADTVGLFQQFTISYEIVNGIGADLDPNSANGLSVDFKISSDNTAEHLNNHADNTTAPVTFSGGTASVIYTSPYATDDYTLTIDVVISSSVLSDEDFAFVNFGTYGATKELGDASQDVDVAVSLAFVYDFKINNRDFISSYYYKRNGTLIELEGHLENNGQELVLENDRNYQVTMSGGGSSGDTQSGVSDANGNFTYSIALNKVNFPNPNSNIIITVTFPGESIIEPASKTFTIRLEGIYGGLAFKHSSNVNATHHIEDTMYWANSENTLYVNGTLTDEDGVKVNGINVKLNINTKQEVNSTWSGIQSTNYGTDTTDVNGFFEFSITIPNLAYAVPWLTLNLTVAATAKWKQPATPVTNEVLSFMYFRTTALTFMMERNVTGSFVEHDINTATISFDYFNDTLYSNFTDNILYNMSIVDEFGRAPIGLNVSVNFVIKNAAGATQATLPAKIEFYVTTANKGVFTVNFDEFTNINNYASYLQFKGYRFEVEVKFADYNSGISTKTVTDRFVIYGQDEVAPSILNYNDVNADSGVEDNVTIIINLDYTKSKLDNIRNLTLYFRYSDNLAGLDTPTYSDDYTIVLMDYYATLQNFNYTILFNGHGRWVQWYVVVYDYAGYGLYLNGTTHKYGGYPGWDHDYTLTDNEGSFASPHTFMMGDITIAEIELADSVTINGESVLNANNITIGDLIIITIALPADLSGYENVSIHYHINTYDPQTQILVVNATITTELMVFLSQFSNGGVTYYVYGITLNSTEIGMGWFTQLDYNFTYFDTAGNSFTTPSVLQYIEDSNPNVKDTWVYDEVDPTGNFNNTKFAEDILKINNTKSTDLATEFEVYNGTEGIYIEYNVTDGFGSGIKYLNVTFYNVTTDLDGKVTAYTVLGGFDLIVNGTIVYEFNGLLLILNQGIGQPVGQYYLAQFFIPAEYLVANTTVSWTLFLIDNANRLTKLNDNTAGGNTYKINVVEPPVPETPIVDEDIVLTTEVVITTDEDGNTITQTTVREVPVEENSNAQWIILGFIGGLSLLILYYQRHNILDIVARRRRRALAKATSKDLRADIQKLMAEGKYKRAIEQIWTTLERVSREVIHAPRKFNQTAREFTEFLSTITNVNSDAIRVISDEYEFVRYGNDPPTRDNVENALNALDHAVEVIIQSGSRVNYEDDDDF